MRRRDVDDGNGPEEKKLMLKVVMVIVAIWSRDRRGLTPRKEEEMQKQGKRREGFRVKRRK